MTSLENRRILVTGGAGFLGKRIIDVLHREGVGDIFVPRSATHDLRSFEVTSNLVGDYEPDAIIHAAAVVGGIGANAENPGRFFYDNAAMGMNIVEACRVHGVEKLVTIGTVCSYPKFTEVPFREETLWDGYPEETNAPYGLAKKAVLTQQLGYSEQYALNSIFLMPANLYGPGDNFNPASSHVIPALILKIFEATESGDEAMVAWGTGSPSREFLFVDDAAEGIVQALKYHDDPAPINLGSGVEITIRELVQTLAGIIGFDGEIRWDSTKPDGQPRRCLDVSKARESFGFTAPTQLIDGLTATVDWYRCKQALSSSSL